MRILIPDFWPTVELDVEEALAGPDVILDVYREHETAGITEESWRSCDAIVCNARVDLDAAVALKSERCRIVVRNGVGYDRVDAAAFAARGIPVCNTPDYGTTEVADSAIALFLSLARGVDALQRELREDPVRHWRFDRAPLLWRLRGAVFGIIGLGRIGAAVGRRAEAFDMRIAFYDPLVSNGTELSFGFERRRTLDELLAGADCVSIHVPLTDATRGLLGTREFALMKRGAILINTARGALVDEDALLTALRSGHLGGAGLDTLQKEPPKADDPLIAAWRQDPPWLRGRLVITPHSAFYSEPATNDMRVKSMETAMLFLRDGVLRNCVNGVTARRW
jgi:lactate dehydrogenase-like 2-hydroxyacid dehydrogenase